MTTVRCCRIVLSLLIVVLSQTTFNDVVAWYRTTFHSCRTVSSLVIAVLSQTTFNDVATSYFSIQLIVVVSFLLKYNL